MGIEAVAFVVVEDDPFTVFTAFMALTALMALIGNTVIGADDVLFVVFIGIVFGANWLSPNVDEPQFGGSARFDIDDVPPRSVVGFEVRFVFRFELRFIFDNEFDDKLVFIFGIEFVVLHRELIAVLLVLEVDVDIFVVLRSCRIYKDSRDRLSSCFRSGGRRLAIWL